MFEHIVTMISNSTPELLAEWNKMPYYSANITGKLQDKFFDEFIESDFEQLKNETSIHKLTYKRNITKPISQTTYYEHIINS